MALKKIRVLIVDDSSIIRSLLARFLSSDPGIEVVGSAPDPFVARDMLIELKPDVMTLDVEMPKMDGITFLEKVMSSFPTRTLIISSLSVAGSETTLRAFEVGAIDVMAKPAIDVLRNMETIRNDIIQKVKAVSQAKIQKHTVSPLLKTLKKTINKDNIALAKTTHSVLAIASSTGGTEALKKVLTELPSDLPGTVVVQHLPPSFTKIFSANLGKICPFEVKEAAEGDKVIPGRVLIAPGDFHIELSRSGAYYYVTLNKNPHLHGVRPAADILMKSVARVAGANALGLILTGMGKDGADGLLAMKKAGSYNIAQDEESCVVFGMPKAAIELRAIDKILPLSHIARNLVDRFKLLEVS